MGDHFDFGRIFASEIPLLPSFPYLLGEAEDATRWLPTPSSRFSCTKRAMKRVAQSRYVGILRGAVGAERRSG